jgi:hypothetical protein
MKMITSVLSSLDRKVLDKKTYLMDWIIRESIYEADFFLPAPN